MKRPVLGFGLILAALVALGATQAIPLRRAAKVGDRERYEVTLKFEIQSNPVSLVQTYHVTVLEASPEAIVTETQDLSMSVNGENTPVSDRPARKVKRDLRGVWLGNVDTPTDKASARFTTLVTPVFPEKPVAPGDKWTHRYSAEKSPSSQACEIVYILEKLEKVDGVDVARVKFDGKELAGEAPCKASGTVWIRLRDGIQFKLQAKAENVPIGNLPEPVTLTLDQRILP